MGAMRNRMTDEMILRGYSLNTQKTYLNHMAGLVKYYKRPPQEITEKDVEKYLLFVTKERKWKPASVNLARSSIIFFYRRILKKDTFGLSIPKQKLPIRRPVVLSREEINSMLALTVNIKHRALLMLAYSCGCRVSELIHLRIRDIDSKRMLIHIVASKGKKDRYTILSPNTLSCLREYYRSYMPKDLLFFSREDKSRMYSIRSAETVFKNAVRRAGIIKAVSIHNLRHSFATHMLEDGASLPYIQLLLGHASTRTTSLYLSITERDLQRYISPLDYFYARDKNDA